MHRKPCLRGVFDLDGLKREIALLNSKAEDPNLWNNQAEAQKVMRERTRIENTISNFARVDGAFRDALDLHELAEGEGDATMMAEAQAALEALVKEIGVMELEALLSGEADANDCFIEMLR